MSISIRKAEAADIPSIISIAEKTWWRTYPGIISETQIRFMLAKMNNAEIFAKQLTQKERIIFLADLSAESIGFANMDASVKNAMTVKIQQLYILPDAQRKGVGQRLLVACEEQARRMGAIQLELNVNRNNPAYNFYLTQGFTVSQNIDIPYGPYILNDYVMHRKIYATVNPAI